MSVDISDLLSPELIAVGVPAISRKALFVQLGLMLAAPLELDAAEVSGALAAREKQGSTGYGGGIAVPHARITGLSRIVAAVVRLQQPVDFAAVDDMPVDVVVAMLSPPDAGADHLKALARVAARLRDRDLVAKLRGAGSRDAVWALLTEDMRDAA